MKNELENLTFQDLFLETNIYLFYIQNMRRDSMYNNHPNIQGIATEMPCIYKYRGGSRAMS